MHNEYHYVWYTLTTGQQQHSQAGTPSPVMEASASFSMSADVFVGAARVTSAYAILFVAVLFWQGMAKLGMAVAALHKREPFDRCVCLP